MRRGLAALLTALALAPETARAAVDTTTLSCPVDGTDVQVSVLLSTDSLLGHDRDLCPHAAGDDEIRSAVSACPVCGFAGTPAEFKAGVDDDVAEKVKSSLARKAGAPALEPWERYANRAQILDWSGAPPAMIGESWLRAAWSVRLDSRQIGDESLGAAAKRVLAEVPQGAAGDDPILGPAKLLDAALEAKKPAFVIAPADRAVAWYLSGSLWRTRGELDAAESRYAKAEKAAVSGSAAAAPLAGVIARDRESIGLEKQYLQRALDRFRAALAAGEKVPEGQRALLSYLTAECARRLGNADEATRWYKAASALGASMPAEDSPGPDIQSLIRQGLGDTKKGKR
jgi:hypothetical protein